MSGYIELMITGNCRAYVEAGNIAGVLTSPDMLADKPATVEKPMSVLLRSGGTIPGVFGVSPNRLLIHIEGAKMLVRQQGRFVVVAYVDHIDKFEEEIQAFIDNGGRGHG